MDKVHYKRQQLLLHSKTMDPNTVLAHVILGAGLGHFGQP
jgi:hypothetical protein